MEIKISEMALKIIVGAATAITLAIINSNKSNNSKNLSNTSDNLKQI